MSVAAGPSLSVIAAVLNRSRLSLPDGRVLQSFPHFVQSVAANLPRGFLTELVVADCGSDDWPLEQWLPQATAGMTVKIIPCLKDEPRGVALNRAAAAASADILCICAADMLIPARLLRGAIEQVRRGDAFFPGYQSMCEDGSIGPIVPDGYEIAFLSRLRWEQSGGWPQRKGWGGDDAVFWDRVYRGGMVARFVVPGLVRLWTGQRIDDAIDPSPDRAGAPWSDSSQPSLAASAHSTTRPARPLIAVASTSDLSELARQTPGGSLRWDDCDFTLDPVDRCDLLVALNELPPAALRVDAALGKWTIAQEPPIGATLALHEAQAGVSSAFVQDPRRVGGPYVQSHGALRWYVGKSFDELIDLPPPSKSRDVSAICSARTALPGHQARLRFLEELGKMVPFDRFGMGIRPIGDKWEALADWRYSIAMENFAGPHYFTEKLVDCFLAWTMPIYFGCTNIETYFPPESIIRIDIASPEAAAETIRQAIRDDWWTTRQRALAEARRLALLRHQIFPFIVRQMKGE